MRAVPGLYNNRSGFRRMLLMTWVLVAVAASGPPELKRARELYQQTRYEEALHIVEAIDKRSPAAWELRGKIRYQQGEFKRACEALEKAVAMEPGNSGHHLWLGRAYGRRAETSSFLTAPGHAVKARRSFEKAVELDRRNLEAMSDLLEYYLKAPGFLGGGIEKAEAVAAKIGAVDAAEHQNALARTAEKRGDYSSAERNLRRAVELEPKRTGRWIDLAKFLARRGRLEESEAAFWQAEQAAPADPRLLYERAGVYVRAKRNLDTARELLARYLNSPLTPDDPPRREAERLLKQATRG